MLVEDEAIKLDDGTVLPSRNYIANDGKRFYRESDCIQYEKELDSKEKIKHISFKTSSIMGFDSWYYISSYDDFKALQNYIAVVIRGSRWTDFDVFNLKNRFVNDWVSYVIIHDEDNGDYCSFTSFKEIKKEVREIQENLMELEKVLKEI